MTLLFYDKLTMNTCIKGYNLLGQYLMSDVPTSFDCRKLLRVIYYIQNNITLVNSWEEEISNGFFISLKTDHAVIGLFDQDYLPCQSPDSPVNVVPYPIFIPILNEWKEICEQRESKCFSNSGDPFLGQCIYGNIVAINYEHLVLEYESKNIFLHKSDIFWKLRYNTCQNYAHIGDKIFVKIVGKQENGCYIGSMIAAQPDSNPLQEPNLVCDAIWQGQVVRSQKKEKFIKYFIDIFPCCWGTFYENTKHSFSNNDIINVRILDIQTITSYSKHGVYCIVNLQIVYDCDSNIVIKPQQEFIPRNEIIRYCKNCHL
jgi:hypothetical protein